MWFNCSSREQKRLVCAWDFGGLYIKNCKVFNHILENLAIFSQVEISFSQQLCGLGGILRDDYVSLVENILRSCGNSRRINNGRFSRSERTIRVNVIPHWFPEYHRRIRFSWSNTFSKLDFPAFGSPQKTTFHLRFRGVELQCSSSL